MCTAATYKTKDFYFGRTLDYEFSYKEEVVITPRNYSFEFRHMNKMGSHYGIIGMAYVSDDYPLYYDAINEKGLGMAGLNFVGNAVFWPMDDSKDNVAQFEMIPYILGECETVSQARILLEGINLVGTNFSESLPSSQLHWIISDEKESITVEPVKEGLKIYNNPVGVLTNNPPFDIQMFMLNNYVNLTNEPSKNQFMPQVDLNIYSRGMGAMGLPGDLSSASRFAKVAFTKMNSKSGESESESVSQFFHILGSVQQQRGCCKLEDGSYEITIYTSCCNATKGIYYYTTYENQQITAVDMHKENLDGDSIVRYPLIQDQQIKWQN